MTCQSQDRAGGYLLTHVQCPHHNIVRQTVTTHGGDRLVHAPTCLRQLGKCVKRSGYGYGEIRNCDDA